MHQGRLTMTMPAVMEIRFLDGTTLRYEKVVRADMSLGCLTNIVGIKLKGYLGLWTEVKSISVDDPSTDKIYFQTLVNLTKDLEVFEKMRAAVELI